MEKMGKKVACCDGGNEAANQMGELEELPAVTRPDGGNGNEVVHMLNNSAMNLRN